MVERGSATSHAHQEGLQNPWHRVSDHIVSGVSRKTHDILQVGISLGVYDALEDRQRLLLDLYYGTDMSTKALAPLIGAQSPEVVNERILSTLGVVYNKVIDRYPALKDHYPPEMVVKLKEIPRTKLVAAIEARFGKPIGELLDGLHNVKKMSTREMAIFLNVGKGTVDLWMEKYNVPKRSLSEAAKETAKNPIKKTNMKDGVENSREKRKASGKEYWKKQSEEKARERTTPAAKANTDEMLARMEQVFGASPYERFTSLRKNLSVNEMAKIYPVPAATLKNWERYWRKHNEKTL